MTAFSRATITIATDPPTEVQAMVRGGLAVHGSAGLYTVTHVASGKAICHSDQQRTAKGIAIEMLEMDVVWDAANISQWEEDRVWAYLEDLKRNPPQTKAKSIVAPPLELEPIYPDYFTPSEELTALDRQIAKGLGGGVVEVDTDVSGNRFGNRADHGAAPIVVDDVEDSQEDTGIRGMVQQASGLEWRETIMVRMGTGKQAKLLDKDIPDKSPPLFPLPPGVLPGYAGVKQLTQRMWRLGQEIGIQAGTMIRYYNNGGDFGQNEFRWWLEQDDEFSALVQSGWCDWAVCVNLFTQLTKEEQQKITDVLGFVGSEEQGYHAYGAKTFMRSKRLPELIRCRRAVREALNG